MKGPLPSGATLVPKDQQSSDPDPAAVDAAIETPIVIERALARAIESATTVGRWDVVLQLAEELRARRLAADGVIDLARGKRGAK